MGHPGLCIESGLFCKHFRKMLLWQQWWCMLWFPHLCFTARYCGLFGPSSTMGILPILMVVAGATVPAHSSHSPSPLFSPLDAEGDHACIIKLDASSHSHLLAVARMLWGKNPCLLMKSHYLQAACKRSRGKLGYYGVSFEGKRFRARLRVEVIPHC
jgi:hypothetical protein